MATRPLKWRILAIFTGPSVDSALFTNDPGGNGSVEEIVNLSGSDAEVLILKEKPLSEVQEQIAKWKPNLVYLTNGAPGLRELPSPGTQPWPQDPPEDAVKPQQLVEALKAVNIDTVYFDCLATQGQAEAIRAHGVANVIFYPRASQALHATQFAHAFFAMLRSMTAPAPEAFAVASHSAQAACTISPGGTHIPPLLPMLLSDAPPKLPNMEGIPLPSIEGLDLSQSVVGAVKGWDSVRLLAPHAELKLLACGQSTLIDAHRLRHMLGPFVWPGNPV